MSNCIRWSESACPRKDAVSIDSADPVRTVAGFKILQKWFVKHYMQAYSSFHMLCDATINAPFWKKFQCGITYTFCPNRVGSCVGEENTKDGVAVLQTPGV